MRTLAPVVTENAEQVDFYLVSFNEGAGRLEGYISDNGYSNMIATQPVGDMLKDLKIVSQSSMIAMDARGVITFRKGYGGRGDFVGALRELAQ